MQRKFYAFRPTFVSKLHVAALGVVNSKVFEAACREKFIYQVAISEEAARRLIVRHGGAGCGCYTMHDDYHGPESLLREIATVNNKLIADIAPYYTEEEPICLARHRQLIAA